MSVSNCKTCGGRTEVLDSRRRDDYVFRRRQCTNCGERFNINELRVDQIIEDKETHLRNMVEKLLLILSEAEV